MLAAAAADAPRGHAAEKKATARASNEGSAETWARGVANVMTDPHFYARFPKERAPYRFSSIIGKAQFDEEGVVLEGRDPSHGVLYLYSNLFLDRRGPGALAWVEDIRLVMPLKDAKGQEVYPILLRLFREKLRASVWVHNSYSRQYGLSHFWRKGTSRYVLHLDKADFEAYGFHEPGPGPWVIVGGGEEQGEAEPGDRNE